MIKRRPVRKPPKLYDAEPGSYSSKRVWTDDLVGQMKRFLDDYFYGAFDTDCRYNRDRQVIICVDGLSFILKLVFRAIYGRALLRISTKLQGTKFALHLEFDKVFLDEQTRVRIFDAAKKSGFDAVLNERGLCLTAEAYAPIAVEVTAGREMVIYNSLLYYFFSPMPKEHNCKDDE